MPAPILHRYRAVTIIFAATLFCAGCSRPSPEVRLQAGLINNDAAAVAQAIKDGAPFQDPFSNQDLRQVTGDKGRALFASNTRHAHSPLAYASYSGQTDIVRVLLDAGADPNAMTRSDGCSGLHLARSAEVATLLLDHKADVNLRTIGHHSQFADGTTPLIMATKAELPAVVKLLLERGAAVNARDGEGFMAIHFVRPVRKDLRELLVSHGADAGDRAWPKTESGASRRRYFKDLARSEEDRRRQNAALSKGKP